MRTALWIATLALLALPGTARDFPTAKKPNAPPIVLHMTAKDFEFDPPEIHVRQGATVELFVTSLDRTHGIHLDPFRDGRAPNTPPGLSFVEGQDCYKLKKGEEVTIVFTAHDPGTYSFKCCKLCGSGHKKMTGKLIVDPQD
ncbi:MAG TPA: cupredoxin domain-containing protein [Verrucomicrobiae bacterium]|nr:cupredoxin domain-containing protein [Verrucomicrobiae bacterium]